MLPRLSRRLRLCGALAHNLEGTHGTLREGGDAGVSESAQDGEARLIVVDPPRAGLGAETTSLLAEVGAPAIVYVSCDPATLARDLRALIGAGYELSSVDAG